MTQLEELANSLCCFDKTCGILPDSVAWTLGEELIAYYAPLNDVLFIAANSMRVLCVGETSFIGDDARYLLENG